MSHHFIYKRCILRFLNKSRKLEPLSCLYNRKYVTRKERREKKVLFVIQVMKKMEQVTVRKGACT